MNTRTFSAILLAGGKSSRMGSNKAELTYKGLSFLEIQKRKLRAVGIEDIIVSGYGEGMVPDNTPGCGPMGGISTCLEKAVNDCAVVLPIDTPLVSEELLSALMEAHLGDVTVIRHGDEPEPLIGIYSKSVLPHFEKLLQEKRYALRRVFPLVDCRYFDFEGDTAEIKNYNTPADYSELKAREQQ